MNPRKILEIFPPKKIGSNLTVQRLVRKTTKHYIYYYYRYIDWSVGRIDCPEPCAFKINEAEMYNSISSPSRANIGRLAVQAPSTRHAGSRQLC